MRFKNSLQRELYYIYQIDYCYWMIKEISNHTGRAQSPIEAMVDKATGFDKENVARMHAEVMSLISSIIENKKKLGYDTTSDKKLRSAIKKIKP